MLRGINNVLVESIRALGRIFIETKIIIIMNIWKKEKSSSVETIGEHF